MVVPSLDDESELGSVVVEESDVSPAVVVSGVVVVSPAVEVSGVVVVSAVGSLDAAEESSAAVPSPDGSATVRSVVDAVLEAAKL